MSYLRFAAMIATSTAVMFGLMYIHTYAWEHVFFSETRFYMAFLMGAAMAVIMLGYMLGMYKNKKVNIGIFIGSALVFLLTLWLVRSQATISGVSYMKAMIPHHSIAILTSERAQITDPRVRKLADEIIEAQEREIAEMRYLIADLKDDENAVEPEIFEGDQSPEVVSLAEALSRVEIASLDPAPMQDAEIDKVLPAGRGCEFSLTASGKPVLVARASAVQGVIAEGVMKLSGKLVPLRSASEGGLEALVAGPTMLAEGASLVVRHVPDEAPVDENGSRRWKADLIFELEQGLMVGYRGFYRCNM